MLTNTYKVKRKEYIKGKIHPQEVIYASQSDFVMKKLRNKKDFERVKLHVSEGSWLKPCLYMYTFVFY